MDQEQRQETVLELVCGVDCRCVLRPPGAWVPGGGWHLSRGQLNFPFGGGFGSWACPGGRGCPPWPLNSSTGGAFAGASGDSGQAPRLLVSGRAIARALCRPGCGALGLSQVPQVTQVSCLHTFSGSRAGHTVPHAIGLLQASGTVKFEDLCVPCYDGDSVQVLRSLPESRFRRCFM